jgi:hypothetical protein
MNAERSYHPEAAAQYALVTLPAFKVRVERGRVLTA